MIGFARFLVTTATLACATPMFADEVSDPLTAALAAYEAGDLRTATAKVSAAATALSQQKNALLEAALPAAPAGLTREVNTDYANALAMMGGGAGTEASYTDEGGNRINVTYTMDSPMLAAMMGMFANDQTLAMMGKSIDVNGVKMLDQENSLTTVADGRILVVMNGDKTEKLLLLAQTIDWAALATFDGPN